MKLFTYSLQSDRPRAGFALNGDYFDLGAALVARGKTDQADLVQNGGLRAMLEHGLLDDPALGDVTAAEGPEKLDPDAIRFLPPTGRPANVIGVGRNYGAHALEGGLQAQEEPRLFAKLTSSVIGHRDPIRRPAGVTKLDWEGEIGVVIGKTVRGVDEAGALGAIAGYIPLNDVTAREFQFDRSPGQTTFAKSLDTFCPAGPVMLAAGDKVDPGGLSLRTFVNDDLVQEGKTDDLIFPIPYLVSFISRYVTLSPGDIIASGTPAGVGHFREPPAYLQPGDEVRVEVEGLPALVNPVVDES